MNEQMFKELYWAHQPPDVRKLRNIFDITDRAVLAMQLAQQGRIIDWPIMVQGDDPFKLMQNRATYGYTWVPNALMAAPRVAPGMVDVGHPNDWYDPNNPPPGAIKVSVNPDDYPPFDPPKPVEHPKPIVPVGNPGNPVGDFLHTFGDVDYFAFRPEVAFAGSAFTDARGTFTLKVDKGPFGTSRHWERPHQ